MKPGLLLAGLWLFIDSFFIVSAVGHGSLSGPGGSAAPDLQARAYPLPPIAPPPSPGGTGVLLKPPALGGFLPALAPPPGNKITVAGPTPLPWPTAAVQPLQAAGAVKPIQPGTGGFMLGQWGGGGTGAGAPALPPLRLATAGNPSGGGGGGGNGSPGGNGNPGGNTGGGTPGNGTPGGNPGGGNTAGGNTAGGNTGGNPGGGNTGGGNPGGNPGGSPPVTLSQTNGLPILVPTGPGGTGGPGGSGNPGGTAALPSVAPVPLPAAGLVLIGAIGALARVGRRRRA